MAGYEPLGIELGLGGISNSATGVRVGVAGVSDTGVGVQATSGGGGVPFQIVAGEEITYTVA